MDDIKWTIKAIAAQFDMTIGEFAKKCDINPNHLLQVSAGNVQMKTDDLVKISHFTGIPLGNICINYSK